MKYLDFIKENKLRSIAVFLLDILFYFSLAVVPYLALTYLQSSLVKIPFKVLGSLDAQSLDEFKSSLFKIMFALISTIFLFFLLLMTLISVIKAVIWLITLKKKFSFLLILKSILLSMLLFVIYAIPLIISFYPIVQRAALGPYQISFVNFFPVLIMVFIIVYLQTYAIYYIVKEGTFRKAFLKTFNVNSIGKKLLPVALFFIILPLLWYLLSFFPYLAGYIMVPAAIILSFFSRLFISKNF